MRRHARLSAAKLMPERRASYIAIYGGVGGVGGEGGVEGEGVILCTHVLSIILYNKYKSH